MPGRLEEREVHGNNGVAGSAEEHEEGEVLAEDCRLMVTAL